MRFAGKLAVVTGAASGIGKASALRLVEEGAAVFAADIDDNAGQALAASHDGKIFYAHCDVRDPEAIKALMDDAAQYCGRIDILVNNAGAGGTLDSIDMIEAADWDKAHTLLLRSVAMGIRYAVPHMKGVPDAAIINIASVAAMSAGMSPTAYSVAKSGVLQLTKMAAADLAKFAIRVNAICPGFITTNIFTSGIGVPKDKKAIVDELVAGAAALAQPVARAGRPEDIAAAVAFLASVDASFINGTHIVVDGGLLIGPPHSWNPEVPSLYEAILAASA